jgi:lysyl-tRNA synthetase class 2
MPHKTRRGGLSVLVTELPQLLSPCLHHLPADLHNEETRIRNRHVDFLVNPKSAHTIRLRSDIIQSVRQFLQDEGHTEVQTPILAAAAGGAIAKPFETSGLEFPDRHIAMRTAPELWLKRMILGGFDRVFEIGSCFRNEGESLLWRVVFEC